MRFSNCSQHQRQLGFSQNIFEAKTHPTESIQRFPANAETVSHPLSVWNNGRASQALGLNLNSTWSQLDPILSGFLIENQFRRRSGAGDGGWPDPLGRHFLPFLPPLEPLIC